MGSENPAIPFRIWGACFKAIIHHISEGRPHRFMIKLTSIPHRTEAPRCQIGVFAGPLTLSVEESPEKFSLSWTKTTSLVRLAFRFPGCSHRLFTKIQSHTKKERRWLDRFHFIPKLLRILSICHEDDKMKTNFKKKLLFFCSFFRWLGLRVSHAPWSYSWCATGVRDRVTS